MRYLSIFSAIVCFLVIVMLNFKYYFMQQFSCQPCDNAMYTGQYQIIRWNTLLEKWEPVKGEIYATEEAAKQRAKELNQDGYN